MIVIVLVALTGFLFTKTSIGTRARGGFRRPVRDRQRAALRDHRLHQDLCRPDARTDQGPTRARRRTSRSSAIGGDTKQAFAIWALKDWSERSRSQKQIQQDLQGRLSTRSPASRPSSSRRRPCPAPAAACRSPWSSSPPATRARSTRWRRRSGSKAQASGKFIIVQNSLAYDAQQVTITVDRDRAAALNLPVRDIGTTLGAPRRRRLGRPVRPRLRTATTSSCRCRRNTARIPSSSAISSSAA